MEIASSKPALLTRREPAMPAHIGFRLLNPEMFGLARLETLESLRLTASELEDLDSNL
jgi:hypothetical protein